MRGRASKLRERTETAVNLGVGHRDLQNLQGVTAVGSEKSFTRAPAVRARTFALLALLGLIAVYDAAGAQSRDERCSFDGIVVTKAACYALRGEEPDFLTQAGINPGIGLFLAREYRAALLEFGRFWVKFTRGTVGAATTILILFLTVVAFALRYRHSFTAERFAALRNKASEVARTVVPRLGLFARYALVPFIIAVGTSEWYEKLDEPFGLLWFSSGLPVILIPAWPHTIILGLCLQAFAVRAHQIASGLPPKGRFWRSYALFMSYVLTLFTISYVGPVVIYFIPYLGLSRTLLGMPLGLLLLTLITISCILCAGLVARCSLMLPAAAIGHPLSPLRAMELIRGKVWQLNIVVATFAALSAGLNWALGQALTLVPNGSLRQLGINVAGQLSVYVATALIASALSIFYRELVAPAYADTVVPAPTILDPALP